MKYKAAVLTVSDKCSRGEREDTSGPALCAMLEQAGFASVSVYGELEERAPGPEERRLCFVCVNGEGGQTPGQSPG